MKPFDVISIDYAWNFKVYSKDTGRGRSAAAHYDTDILTWNDWRYFIQWVWPVMAANCAICLWMVRPSQNVALADVDLYWNQWIQMQTLASSECVNDYGFTFPRQKDRLSYKTELFTLMKTYRNGKPVKGMGYYSRANTEPCMLYVRGKMPRTDKGVDQVIPYCPYEIDKAKRHSYKPPEYRRRIERLWPNRRYLEIFAREDAGEPGWVYLGNEVTGNDIRDDLRRLASQIEGANSERRRAVA